MLRKNSILNCKKGVFEQSITVVLVLFILGILAIVSYNIFTDINTDIQNMDDISADAKAMSSDLHARFPSTLDGAFILAFIMLWLLLLVAIWYFDNNPLFIVVIIIFFVILLISAGMFSNFWEDMATSADFDFSSSFPSTYFVLNNFLLVMAVVAISGFSVMYMKSRS